MSAIAPLPTYDPSSSLTRQFGTYKARRERSASWLERKVSSRHASFPRKARIGYPARKCPPEWFVMFSSESTCRRLLTRRPL